MRKSLLLVFLFIIAFIRCAKEDQGCTNVSPAVEEPQILAYAAANGINVTKHSSGVYYQIINTGTGTTPSLNSLIYITYEGKLLNGTQFDKATDASKTGWALHDLIEGWQIGLPLIKKGGRMKLIIPSALAYGCIGKKDVSGNVVIPSNSVLYFDVTIVDVE